MPESPYEHLLYKTYLSVIEGSIGTAMFQHAYVREKETGKELDILDTGDLACAFHVSGILTIMRYIDQPHATVNSTLKAMEVAGWTKTEAPQKGDVILWDKHPVYGTEHVGFYWDSNQAISNSFEQKVPIMHPINAERTILGYWTRNYETTLTQ